MVRTMTDDPVTPEDLAAIADAARWAPSAGNRRLQPIVTVTDQAVLRRLRMVSPGMLARPQAALVVCIDTARAGTFGFAPDNPGLFIDVGTKAATILLATHAVGLAAEPVTSFSRVAAAVLLGLDRGTEPRLMVCIGHPAASQPPPMGGWARSPGGPRP